MTQPTPPGKWPTPVVIVTCSIGLVVMIFSGLAIIGSFLPPVPPAKTTQAVGHPTTAPATTTAPAPTVPATTNPARPSTVPPSTATTQPPTTEPPLTGVPTGQVGNIPPVPNAQATAGYLATLERISAEIKEGGPPEALVARGRDQCRDLKERPKSTWVWWAQQRFNSNEHPDGFDPRTSERIIAAARKYICPNY